MRFTDDSDPGLRRVGHARPRYLRANGTPVRDRATLARIAALAIPPAWTDVWICADPRGHVQATGRDARGRKQYRYHERWRTTRDATKFEKLVGFGTALPGLRARVDRDLGKRGLGRERVLATIVRLLETTLVRVGNDEYALENQTYGLSTLEDRHVARAGEGVVEFRFRAKSGKARRVRVTDARVARVVRRCQDLPGQRLFEYQGDDGEVRAVGSADVNDYLRESCGDDFTAKDFRTWAATVLAARALRVVAERAPDDSPDTQIVRAVEAVAACLGNTPAVCRASYVHPAILESHRAGRLLEALDRPTRARRRLGRDEAAVLALLRRAGRKHE